MRVGHSSKATGWTAANRMILSTRIIYNLLRYKQDIESEDISSTLYDHTRTTTNTIGWVWDRCDLQGVELEAEYSRGGSGAAANTTYRHKRVQLYH